MVVARADEPSTLLGGLLPAGTSVAEAFGDGMPGGLFPDEQALIARAVERRRQEFATGRRCAREALAGLGFPPAPVLAGPRREPVWPPGVVGSITHCDGYRAAAVARSRDALSLGVDAEPNAPLPRDVLASIATATEIARVRELAITEPGTSWDRLLFSAKESLYKTWFPVTRRWLGFKEAEVSLGGPGGTFTARLLGSGLPYGDSELTMIKGYFAVARGLVITAIAVPPPGARQ